MSFPVDCPGFGLGSREREEGQSVCGRQSVGEPRQGGGMQVEMEGWVPQQLDGSRSKTGPPAWLCPLSMVLPQFGS